MLSSALVAFISANVALAAKSLSVDTVAPASLTGVDSLEVVTTITNTGDETVTLLNDPRTILSSWATQSFVVTGENGVPAAFTGVAVRYIPEVVAKKAEKSVTVLAAGESYEVVHEVGNFFNFTAAGPGQFTIAPLTSFHALAEDGTLSVIEATASNAKVSISGALSSSKMLSPASLGGSADSRRDLHKRATYSSCSSTRQTQNNAAISAASTLATRSVSHLTSNSGGSSLQTTWYGTFSSSRYSSTLASFRTLVSAPAGWRYDCTCTDSDVYAYVYPSSYGTVYLCGYYWQAPATGSGSRADTIIHEGTHFPQVLGTDDWAYGESACKSLAASNPTRAVDNADNHAFFSDYA